MNNGIELKHQISNDTYNTLPVGGHNLLVQFFSEIVSDVAVTIPAVTAIECNVWAHYARANQQTYGLPSGDASLTADSGSWTDGLTGVNQDDGTKASIELLGSNDVATLTCGNFGLGSKIPVGATIVSVFLEVQNEGTTGGTQRHVIRVGGVDGANNDNSTTTETVRTFGPLTRPGGGSWTRDDLLDGTLTVRVEGRQPGGGTDRFYIWDYVKVIVNYTTAESPNVQIGVVVEKVSHLDGSYTEIARGTSGSALTTTSAPYNFDVTTTAEVELERGDRVRGRIYFADHGGEMSPNLQLTATYNGPTSLANGDTYIEFPQDINFYTIPGRANPVTLGSGTVYYFRGPYHADPSTEPTPFFIHENRPADPGEPDDEWDQLQELTVDGPTDGIPAKDPLAGYSPLPSDDVWWLANESFFFGVIAETRTLPLGVTLSGLVRLQLDAWSLPSDSVGMRAELVWAHPDVDGGDPQVWAGGVMSPLHSPGDTFGGVQFNKGYVGGGPNSDIPTTVQIWLAAPDAEVPEGGSIGIRVYHDDSFRDMSSLWMNGSTPTAGGLATFNVDAEAVGENGDSLVEFTQTLFAPAIDQSKLRARNDDGDESGATWKAATNVGWEQNYDENFRIRVSLDEVGGADPPSTAYKLQANVNGGTFTDVTSSSTHVKVVASPHLADGAATTNQLGGALGGGEFVAGSFDEVDGVVATTDLPVVGKTEYEWALLVPSGGGAGPGSSVRFRVVESDGTPLARYGGNPVMTIPGAAAVASNEGGIWIR